MIGSLLILLLVLIASFMFWKSRSNKKNSRKLDTLKVSRKFHKWLMLFIGIQFVIWSISGAYMVMFDIDYIHGDSLVKNPQTTILPSNLEFSLQNLLREYPKAENIEVGKLIDEDVYRFSLAKEKYLVSANSGQLLSPISQEQARELAKHYYADGDPIVDIILITDNPPFELSPRALPAWRVNFDAFGSPSLYISAQNGMLMGKRHEFWRTFDLMWRLHIMDYEDGDEIDNLLLFWITIMGLAAALSGLILTYFRVFKSNEGDSV